MRLKPPKREEFKTRLKNAREEIEINKIDLLFIYSNDRAVHGPGNVRYFSNFSAHLEDVAIVIFKNRKPILLTGPECKEYGEKVSFIEDIRVIKEFAMPDEEYPFTEMTSLRNIINEVERLDNQKVKKIGIIGLDIMPYFTFQRIKDALSESIEIINKNNIIFKLRSIKSDWEKEVIISGYKLNELALNEAIKILKPGASEFKVASVIEKVFRENNAEGTAIDTIVSFGLKNTRPILNRPSETKLKKNDFGLLTFGPKLHGYCPAIGRPFIIGKAPCKFIEAIKVALEAQEKCQEALKPGILGSEVEAIGRKVLTKSGLEKYFVYAGIHSVGLAEFEPPIFGPKAKDIVKPGMILSIDIPIFIAPWGGLRVEDGFLITQNGNIPLNNYKRDIINLKNYEIG